MKKCAALLVCTLFSVAFANGSIAAERRYQMMEGPVPTETGAERVTLVLDRDTGRVWYTKLVKSTGLVLMPLAYTDSFLAQRTLYVPFKTPPVTNDPLGIRDKK